MSPPVFDGSNAARPGSAPPPARADRPESNPAQGFDGEQFGALAETDAANGDGVQHSPQVTTHRDSPTLGDGRAEPPDANRGKGEEGHRTGDSGGRSTRDGAAADRLAPTWSEAERVAFLRRAQQEGNR